MRKIDAKVLDVAVEAYVAGKTLKEVEVETGVKPSVLSRELKHRGIAARSRRVDLPVDEVASLYASGMSEFDLAAHFSVCRPAVGRAILESGVPRRGRSDAGLLRMGRLTVEERQALSAAAHDAARGRVVPESELIRSALTKQNRPKVPSIHEASFAKLLDELGTDYRREVAIRRWNVDFVIGDIAIEILGGEWHTTPKKTAFHSRRTPEILAAGWTLLFIWSNPTMAVSEGAATYAVKLANASADRSMASRYQVLRGDGLLLAEGDVDDFLRDGIPAGRLGLPDATGKIKPLNLKPPTPAAVA